MLIRSLHYILFVSLFSAPWLAASANPENSADSVGVHRDAHGALRDADMLPASPSADTPASAPAAHPGTNRTSGAARQGDIDSAQSGPGAAGLFTPDSPGNAAAYHAQLNGELQGSPIVNGTGANVVVKVPMATPSGNPSYKQLPTGGITPGTGAQKGSALLPNDFKGSPVLTPAPAESDTQPNRRGSDRIADTNTTIEQNPALNQSHIRYASPGAGTVINKSAKSAKSANVHELTKPRVGGSGFIQYADGQTIHFGAGHSR